ncbi:ABC transporter permease [Bacillus alkalisoli]|uniref:ABC transporter permease n=1 Tax=Bacillus alkalisoli TaxID=2011008 RepID=UPI000C23DF5A|nr:ABC transporter permease [Bacillus alkalisoli]
MNSLITVLKEQLKSFYLVKRLSVYEMKSANSNNYIGVLWEIINPMIQISIFWFVFGYGVLRTNGRGDIELYGQIIPYFPWMLSGIVVWFFINQSIIQGSQSVYSRINMMSKMSFPMSTIPTFVTVAKLYQHLMLLVVVLLIFQIIGYPINIYYLQLPYFIFATLVFLVSFSLITSTISTLIRDVHNLIQAVVRLLIFLLPILWPPYKIEPQIIQTILKLNPIYYLVEGYRASILGLKWYPVEHLSFTIYFWIITLVLLLIGSSLHVKFRSKFVDYL